MGGNIDGRARLGGRRGGEGITVFAQRISIHRRTRSAIPLRARVSFLGAQVECMIARSTPPRRPPRNLREILSAPAAQMYTTCVSAAASPSPSPRLSVTAV